MVQQAVVAIAQGVLTNILQHGWNPDAAYKGNYKPAPGPGGLFINWQYNDPSITNVQGNGVDITPYQTNHDPQVCLRYLQCVAKYLQISPQERQHLDNPAFPHTRLNTFLWHVIQDFTGYSTPKGFIYFSLLETGQKLRHQALLSLAKSVAQSFMRSYRNGYFWSYKATGATYSTNSCMGVSAALLDNALRFPNETFYNTTFKMTQGASDCILAAKSGLDHILAVARDATYGLCWDTMSVDYVAGNDQPVPIAHTTNHFSSRASTSLECAEHLLTAARILGNPDSGNIHPLLDDPIRATTYQNAAYQMVNSVYALMWDTTLGGFFFNVDTTGYSVTRIYKETRATATAIRAYLQTQAFTTGYAPYLQQCVNVLCDDTKFYKSLAPGYVYRTKTDFSFYVTSPGQGVGLEDQVTTEAMGVCVDALLSYSLLTNTTPLLNTASTIGRTGQTTATTRTGQGIAQGRSGASNQVASPGKIGP